MITPPFKNYHRAELERLVHEGFEKVELKAAKEFGSGCGWFDDNKTGFISNKEFQVLVAADFFLRTTK